MLITMLTERTAAPDGITVQTLTEGETYDVPDEFGARYIDKGYATEKKLADPAPENKSRAKKKA